MLTKLDTNTQVIVQGITGKEGQRVTEYMLASRVNVVGGIRPGKGGQTILGLPVFNTIKEAQETFPHLTVSCVYVPPAFVLPACQEAIESKIPFLHIIAEGVPLWDTARLLARARNTQTQILGPSSLGMIIPGKFKLGSIGGEDNSSFLPGNVGIISRSGGMSSEVSFMLTRSGIGQSMVIHLGGDYLIGLDMEKTALQMQADANTKIILVLGEVGGKYELKLAQLVASGKIKKPVIVFLSGQFTESLPQGVPLGHAGAIIGGVDETREGKKNILKKSGIKVLDTPDKIISTIMSIL